MMSDILLVGDNLHNVSWGARGATLSLIEVLEQQYRVASTLGGDHYHLDSANYGLVSPVIPARYSGIVLHAFKNRTRRKVFGAFSRVANLLGTMDFVARDPGQTADNILRYRGKYAELANLFESVEQADAVIVNGEGDLVFTTPPRREALLMLGVLALAQSLAKPSFLVNAMLSDCPLTGRNTETATHAGSILDKCTAVALRDSESVRIGREIAPQASILQVPDSLFAWQDNIDGLCRSLPACGDYFVPWPEDTQLFGKLDFGQDYICLGGGGGVVGNESRAVRSYCGLVEELRRLGLPVYLFISDGRDAFLRDVARVAEVPFIPAATPIKAAACMLAASRLVVSGRYHPTILASLGGTPSIYLDTIAHKMTSLQALLEPPVRETFPALPDAGEARRIGEVAKQYIDSGEALREDTRCAARACAGQAQRLPFLLQEAHT